MAALDWSQCQAVESISGKVSGAWVFKGTRLPVMTGTEPRRPHIDEVIEQFDVTREQIAAVLEFRGRESALRRFHRCSPSLTTARRRAWRERCPFTRCTRRSPGAGTGLSKRRVVERR